MLASKGESRALMWCDNYPLSQIRISRQQLISRFRDKIVSVHAFGSKARGDHDKGVDFEILIVVKNRNLATEDRIMEEIDSLRKK